MMDPTQTDEENPPLQIHLEEGRPWDANITLRRRPNPRVQQLQQDDESFRGLTAPPPTASTANSSTVPGHPPRTSPADQFSLFLSDHIAGPAPPQQRLLRSRTDTPSCPAPSPHEDLATSAAKAWLLLHIVTHPTSRIAKSDLYQRYKTWA